MQEEVGWWNILLNWMRPSEEQMHLFFSIMTIQISRQWLLEDFALRSWSYRQFSFYRCTQSLILGPKHGIAVIDVERNPSGIIWSNLPAQVGSSWSTLHGEGHWCVTFMSFVLLVLMALRCTWELEPSMDLMFRGPTLVPRPTNSVEKHLPNTTPKPELKPSPSSPSGWSWLMTSKEEVSVSHKAQVWAQKSPN